MALFSIFKINKPRQFNFQPRYYNERKDRLNTLIENAEGKSGGTSLIQPGFLKNQMSARTKEKRAINFRVYIIIAILVMLLYQYLRN